MILTNECFSEDLNMWFDVKKTATSIAKFTTDVEWHMNFF